MNKKQKPKTIPGTSWKQFESKNCDPVGDISKLTGFGREEVIQLSNTSHGLIKLMMATREIKNE